VALGLDVRGFHYGGRTHDEGPVRKVVGRLADLLVFPLLVMRHRPAIVHLNSAFDRKGVARDVFFVWAARLMGRRVVVKCHGADLELLADGSRWWRSLTWLLVRGCHIMCLLSGEEKVAFEHRFGSVGRFEVVHNALDFARYHQTRDFRAEHNIPPDKPLLLFIARFIEAKGLYEVIRALPRIIERHEVHAAFVGDGPVRDDCEALCREMGLAGRTTFTGYIPEDETANAYLASDVLVFPTYHQEGMPMVVFHSLACGVPVITTRIRAAADLLEDGRTVLFVPPRDAEAVADAVIRLLEDPALRERMRRDGRELAGRFDRMEVARHFVELYASLTGTAGWSAKRGCVESM
jgi:glycosyltransferase involved in cell wall biosynthesis